MAVYEININFGGKGKGGNGKGGSGEENDKTKVPSKEGMSTSPLMYIASKEIQPFLQQATSHVSNSISLITGRKVVSERINLAMQLKEKTAGAVASASAGVMFAKSAGMSVGKGIGIGLVVYAVSTGINLAFKSAEMQARKQAENLQTSMVYSRAGTNVNASREGI